MMLGVSDMTCVSLVLQSCAVVILLHCGGQVQAAASPPPIIASVGDDVTLPCRRAPPIDPASLVLEWGRPDLSPRFVHIWAEGRDLLVQQNPSYKGRTSVSKEGLKQGDLSLKLSTVKVSDGGLYRCFTPKQKNESHVQLIVGAVSHPVIGEIQTKSSGDVELQCESAGWHPEPDLSWLDSKGNILSPGSTKTFKDPEGLYTITSRLTVKDGTSFTCRVHQKDISQTRETQIHVSAECPSSSGPAAAVGVSLTLVFLLLALGGVFVLSKQKKTMKSENERQQAEKQLLLNDQENLGNVVDKLQEQKKKLEEKREELRNQMAKIATEREELEKDVETVERESDKAKAFWELKKILLNDKENVKKRKLEHEQLEQNTTELITNLTGVLSMLKVKPDETVGDEQTVKT